ncbi:MAG: hypothetical protein LBQ40_07510 [Clostridiales bacterium]|jgi:hypothetical protein|nr:hypothetical protein [Clostridiales bacterium]
MRGGVKRAFMIIAAIVITIAIAAAVVWVLTKKNEIDLTNNICYSDRHVYSGKNGDLAVTVYAGVAEKSFLTDGKASEVVNFCKIGLNVINTAYSKVAAFDYNIIADGKLYAGKLTRDSLTSEMSGSVDLPDASKIKSIVIRYGSKDHEIPLSGVLDGRMSADDAYKAAVKIFSKEISNGIKNGVFNREIYIKFVTGYGGEEPYYWYVAFIASDSDYWAVLMDSRTGEVDVKRG